MFAKILVGTDLSPESVAALEQVLPIARRSGAGVVLMSAVEPEHVDLPWLSAETRDLVAVLAELDRERRRDGLQAIRQDHVGQGVDISQIVVDGPPERALAEVAAEIGADLIAVGARGEAERHRFLLGSVAERIVRHAACDVLVARGANRSGRFQRILVPTDFSTIARRAVDRAVELAEPGGRITLLHCWNVPPEVAGYSAGNLTNQIKASADARLADLAASIASDDLAIETVARSGYPTSIIRELAGSADLVVVGSHGRRGVRRLILGSVAEKTIRHAPCSVFVATGRAESG